MENIDYEGLKKRGFLKQRQDGFFIFRTRMSRGVYKKEDLEKLAGIAERYAKGFVHATVRQGIEIPFVRFEDIPKIESEVKGAGMLAGTSGARLRTMVVCPGNNWCRFGLIDTFSLAGKIENLDIRCGMDLPHKFKIAVSGCPNACARPQAADIGIHGQANPAGGGTPFGYVIYAGGGGGRSPRFGLKLDKIFTEGEALRIIEKIIELYKKRAKPGQRLGLLIEELGRENFLSLLTQERNTL